MNNVIKFTSLNDVIKYVNSIDCDMSVDDIAINYNVKYNGTSPVAWYFSNDNSCGLFGCEYVTTDNNHIYMVYGMHTDFSVSIDELYNMLNDLTYYND